MYTCFVAIEKINYWSTKALLVTLIDFPSISLSTFSTVRVKGQHCVHLCRQRTSSPCRGKDYQGPTLEPGLEPQPSPMG